MPSELERAFSTLLKQHKIPPPEAEYPLLANIGRKHRADFAWPKFKVAVEVEGGAFIGGRHVQGGGFEKDIEKYNLCALQGWIVLRATRAHIASGQAMEWLKQALEVRAA
jgi:very-short-patch-repair endonuclease